MIYGTPLPCAPWSSAGTIAKPSAAIFVALSTYLGHTHVTDTYWYLQATPILMRQIAAAGEALHQGAVS